MEADREDLVQLLRLRFSREADEEPDGQFGGLGALLKESSGPRLVLAALLPTRGHSPPPGKEP